MKFWRTIILFIWATNSEVVNVLDLILYEHTNDTRVYNRISYCVPVKTDRKYVII